jgi:titin
VQAFRWTVTDGRGRYATEDGLIDIRHPNTAPVAQNATLRMGAGSGYADITVPASDPDTDDEATIRQLGAAAHGRVAKLSDTSVRYTPSENLPVGATDSFTYTVGDNFGDTATATVQVTVVEPSAPTAPALGAVTVGNGVVGVRWAAPTDPGSSPVSAYVVRAYYGSALVRSVSVAASARSVVVPGLFNGRPYTVSVSAVNAVGSGPASARSAAVVPRTVASAPRIGRASAGHSAVVVRWAAPASNGGAALSSYVVRTYRGAALVRSTTVSARSTGVTVGGLTPGVVFTFRVQAVNAAGVGPASAAVSVRPAR